MKIALTGNPNSGKTTMFNALTGKNERVGNWAGVTVDKAVHTVRKSFYSGEEELLVIDLPGAYSMSPFTSEESVASSYVKNENPDVIINIVDAANLSRSLFFTTQLLELGIPMVIALNKSDVNIKNETTIDTDGLSAVLGCPVIKTISTSCEGLKEVIDAAVRRAGSTQKAPYREGNIDITDRKAVEAADRRRYVFVSRLVAEVEKRKVLTREKNISDKIDMVLTNKWLGIPVFTAVMFLLFQISQGWVGPFLADMLSGLLKSFQGWVGSFLANADPFLHALLIDGVIGGVIAVIGFLPLVMVMYFMIALLEDCGYMARVSVVLDSIFKRVGLSGKSVIPFVIGTGCSIPGIMACRTIRNDRERRAAAMLTPFMPCGAKLSVIALFSGAFFEDSSWVGTMMYFAGIVLIFISALLINKITGNRAKKSFFIIEIPEYKAPSLLRAFQSMCSRGWSYIVKASTVILLCNTIIQIMQTFSWSFEPARTADSSILASIAHPFAYILLPVAGVISWQLAAAAITGFIAKENVVGTLAVCFAGLENLIDTEKLDLAEGAGTEAASVFAITKAAALAYLMFNLFTPPCFAAIGAMSSEMKSAKWLWSGLGLQMCMGFTVGFFVYQIGTLITTGAFGEGFFPGFVSVFVMASVIAALCIRGDRLCKEKPLNPLRNG